MPPIHNDNQTQKGKGSSKKRVRKNNDKVVNGQYYNEMDDSHNENENRGTKRGKFDHENDDSDEDISDSSNSESAQTTPPPRPKPSKATGPNTPSPSKDVKYSDSTPDSTPRRPSNPRSGLPGTDLEGAVKCLTDFVETEGKKYLRKLSKVASLSESEIQSAEELAKSGAMLSEHGEKIRKLGHRLLSISKDRFDKYFKNLPRPSSPDH